MSTNKNKNLESLISTKANTIDAIDEAELGNLIKVFHSLQIERSISPDEFLSLPQEERRKRLEVVTRLSREVKRLYISRSDEVKFIESTTADTVESKSLGKIVVISGPSGVGKDTAISLLLAKHPELEKFITATTRQPRPGEVEGVNYHYINSEQYMYMHSCRLLLDRLEYANNLYGIPSIELKKREDSDIIINAVPNTVRTLRMTVPETKSIIILPPGSTEAEQEKSILKRLLARNTESKDVILRRIEQDRDNFRDFQSIADHIIISEDGDASGVAQEIANFLRK
jgi:guanylate kinase